MLSTSQPGSSDCTNDLETNGHVGTNVVPDPMACDQNPANHDFRAMLLGQATLKPDSSPPVQTLTDEHIDNFKTYLAKRRPKLDETQTTCVMDTVLSDSGVTAIKGPAGSGKTFVLEATSNALVRIDRKVMICAPRHSAVVICLEAFDEQVKKEQDKGGLRDSQYVHIMQFNHTIEGAAKLEKGSPRASQDSTTSFSNMIFKDDEERNAYARSKLSRHGDSSLHTWSFGRKLKTMIEKWASEEVNTEHPYIADAKEYLVACEPLFEGDEREMQLATLHALEARLAATYLEHFVKVVFCTLGAATLPILSNFHHQHLLIDDSSGAAVGSLLPLCDNFRHCVQHITLTGDHKQDRHRSSSTATVPDPDVTLRNLFHEIAINPKSKHRVIALTEGHRMGSSLFKFPSTFYGKDWGIKTACSTGNIDMLLQNTVDAYWTARLRPSFRGSKRQVAIDVTSPDLTFYESVADTSISKNVREAICTALIIIDMLKFSPPQDTATRRYRCIRANDIMILSPQLGQILEISEQLRVIAYTQERESLSMHDIFLSTIEHARGSQRPIVFFSIVFNPGITKLPIDEEINIGHFANDRSINVALSRARIGRYIIGGLTYLAQMAYDKHPQAKVYNRFFGLIRTLAGVDNVISAKDIEEAILTGSPPNTSGLQDDGYLHFLKTLDRSKSDAKRKRHGQGGESKGSKRKREGHGGGRGGTATGGA